MLPTNHITRAQARIATIEGLATGYRQPRHLQRIVTPARTNGRIGRNQRKSAPPAWAGVVAALIGTAIFAAALGMIAGELLR
jgi:hypothetical protein